MPGRYPPSQLRSPRPANRCQRIMRQVRNCIAPSLTWALSLGAVERPVPGRRLNLSRRLRVYLIASGVIERSRNEQDRAAGTKNSYGVVVRMVRRMFTAPKVAMPDCAPMVCRSSATRRKARQQPEKAVHAPRVACPSVKGFCRSMRQVARPSALVVPMVDM